MSLFGDASAMLADFKLSAASAGLPVTSRSPPALFAVIGILRALPRLFGLTNLVRQGCFRPGTVDGI
jgi:hypothetical protein